jgi:hypothetical protein
VAPQLDPIDIDCTIRDGVIYLCGPHLLAATDYRIWGDQILLKPWLETENAIHSSSKPLQAMKSRPDPPLAIL